MQAPEHPDPLRRALTHALRTWERASELCEDGSCRGEPEAVVSSEALGALPSAQVAPRLREWLEHPRALVAAYALLTLLRVERAPLAGLPAALFTRTERMRVRRGCFAATVGLGEFARRLARAPFA